MPFYREMGDMRTGHDFLRGMTAEEWGEAENIRNMAATEEGREKLDRLAAALEARVAPLLAIAQGMSGAPGGGEATCQQASSSSSVADKAQLEPSERVEMVPMEVES